MTVRALAPRAAGLLLTGGASRRMGTDKASLVVNGLRLAVAAGRALAAVTAPTFELGPGRSELEPVADTAPGKGPLAALAQARGRLGARLADRPAVVLACDLPGVTAELLAYLAEHPGSPSVVPVVGGRPQLLCARWSSAALACAPSLVAGGRLAMRSLLGAAPAVLCHEREWGAIADAGAFADVDEPADLDRLRP
ncbi:MAG: molybdenum cofactor guanylyltransferase [Acidimicrobiales bacterium]